MSAPRHILRRLSIAAVIIGLVACLAPGQATAQSLNFGSAGNNPVEIFADNGIEWQQEQLVFVARGNARAVRGEVTVFADELRAYYRKRPDGGSDLWRLDAIGKVRIKSPESTTYGGHAIYHIEKTVLVVTGGNVRLVTKTDIITAERQLEYWENKQMAVARGNASAKRDGKTLRAKVLAAYFKKDKKGNSSLYRVEAFENVQIITPKDRAEGNTGVYNVKSGIATLDGAVKIFKGGNVLKGCSADVNLNTGVSRLRSCQTQAGGGKTRVRGVLLPGSGKNRGKKSK